MSNVLILDGNQRSALAATRSLGMKGITVFVSEESSQSLSGCSKYCSRQIQLPPIATDPDNFINELCSTISKHRIEVLLPMTDISTTNILQNKDRFINVGLPTPSFKSYSQATNKNVLFRLAATLNIRIPQTRFIDNISDLDPLIDDLTYPLVIKPSLSRVCINNLWITTTVLFAYSKYHLLDIVNNHEWLRNCPFMLQEFIKGHGQGIFAFYNNGTPVTFFAHKRIREKPPSGGVSVLHESVAVDPDMKCIAETLLTNIGWHGAAMVEFKIAMDGTPYLMEINGRFWGSLQLAIDSGLDFPYLAYLLAIGETLPSISRYKSNIRSRWLLGDLDRLYLVLKADSSTYSIRTKLHEIFEFMKFYSRDTYYEVNRFSDFRPFIYELKSYIKGLVI